MKLWLFLFASSLVFAADWDAVQRIPAAQRIEVTERSGGGRVRGTLVSASPETVVVRESSGERSIPRADIRELPMFDFGRRTQRGLLWTLIGAGAGAGQFGGVYRLPGCPAARGTLSHGAAFCQAVSSLEVRQAARDPVAVHFRDVSSHPRL